MTAPLSLRYGTRIEGAIPLNETIETILGHRTCRAYADRAVPEALLLTLIAAAQSAPSSCNLQCWSVVAVSDPADRAELARLSGNQRHVAEAPLVLCFLADLDRIGQIAELKGLGTETLDYLEMLLVGVIDATLAAQNLATAAESLGLGTSFIGGLRNDIAAVGRFLDLPDRIVPVFGLTLGYPDPARPNAVKPRLAQQAVLHHGRYRAPDIAPVLADYEGVMADFNAGQGRDVEPWGTVSAKRIATTDRMEGRDLLRAKLNAAGFALK